MPTELLDRDLLFFNIVPYSPGKEKETAGDILDYVEKTGNAITGPVHIHFSSMKSRMEGESHEVRCSRHDRNQGPCRRC